MSKLDELIQQYCPDGVEYKPLGEVCDIHKGVQFNKTDMKEEGSYPVINGGINPSGYVEVFNDYTSYAVKFKSLFGILSDDALDLFPGFAVHIRAMVQHAGHGGHADAGLLGDVLDGVDLHAHEPPQHGRRAGRSDLR